MVERSRKPSALPMSPTTAGFLGSVETQAEKGIMKLSLPTGESAEILLYGATVISWKTADGQEKLFLSDKAKLDGTKAVRGGIPLVFPVFGTTDSGPAAALPQHGFARTSKWELLGRTSETGASVQVDFGLGAQSLPADQREKWPYPFGLIYSVTLSANSLETKMVIQNESEETFQFQVLFHTYFKVPDISDITVTGLKGVTYKDKVKAGATAIEESETLSITSETDRVYAQVPGTVTIESKGTTLYKVERSNLDDVVVWNPWTEAANKIGDFGPADGHQNMICVEAGSVAKWHSLEPKSVWEGGQEISVPFLGKNKSVL